MGAIVKVVTTDGGSKTAHLGPGGNLRNVHFPNSGLTNLRGLDLHGADLRDANLAGVDLRGANLNDALYNSQDLARAILK